MATLDQFEIGTTDEYSGSMSTNFILGSILQTVTGSRATIFNSSRKVAGSKRDGINSSYFSDVPKWQYSRYFEITERRQVAGNVGFTSVFDSTLILDSVAPDIVQISIINGERIFSGGLGTVSDSDFNIEGGTGTELASVIIDTTSSWLKSFPFQTKYKNLLRFVSTGRNLQVATASMTKLGQVTLENPNGDVFTILDVSSSNPTTDFDLGNVGNYFDDSTAHGGFLLVPIEIVKKFFFGFGEGFAPKSGATLVQAARYSSMPEFFVRSFPDPDYLAGPLIRGFRYGLFNANLVATNATYRRSHYGQFRDLLEPRKYTATLIKNGIDRPLQILFKSGSVSYQRSLIYATASNPTDFNFNDSGIYDIFYRSGKPFFD